MITMSVTNNNNGGQPVTIENLKATYELAREYSIPVFIDACRANENAAFNKIYNPSCKDLSIREILRQTFEYCDGFLISLKKMLCNMGGFVAIRRDGLFYDNYPEIGHFMKQK